MLCRMYEMVKKWQGSDCDNRDYQGRRGWVFKLACKTRLPRVHMIRMAHFGPVWRTGDLFGALGTRLAHVGPVWCECDPFGALGTNLARVGSVWREFGIRLSHVRPVWRMWDPFGAYAPV